MERRDADGETFYATDTAIAGVALQWRGKHAGDRAGAGHRTSTVREYLARAAAAGIGWPLGADVTDESLMARLFVNAGVRAGARFHAEPDWAALVLELKRPAVNLMILWDEYRAVHPDGYAYSRFCQLFREFERRLSPTMRQQHVAGHKLFVDYSGKRIPIADPLTGEVRMAEIFVAVLGASNCTYAEATWTQTLPGWIGAHVRMFRFYGAVPRLLVPDNLKSGINKASFYDPEVNRSYAAMATHYGVGVLPARPKRPRDKAAVEAGVRFAQSYILGRLRNVTFFSLAECNAAIAAAVKRMNGREMRRLGTSRRQLFEAIELPVMRRLPQDDFEYAEWRLSRRGPGVPLLGAACPDPRAGGHPGHGAHDRGVPPWQTRRRSRAALWRTAARHPA
jgi:transposase